MRKHLCLVALAGLVFSLNACSSNTDKQIIDKPAALVEKTSGQSGFLEPASSPSEMNMKLTIKIGNDELAATLYDSAAAKDFLALLPITVTLEDYNKTEKIGQLAKRLSTAGMPAGYDPSEGDIAYYVPWGNMCIFYHDFRYSDGLVHLGKITGNGIDKFRVSGPVTATIDVSR